MAFKNGYRLWDKEFEQQYWTPEEIEMSNEKVARIDEIVKAEHNGEISHEEAMIRHLMLDPDLADIMLEDAINDGDIRKIRKVHRRIEEAKTRTLNTLPNSAYWESVVDNAEQTAKEGKNLETIIALMTRALGILKAAVPASV